MAPQELEGENLGDKHRTYNKILQQQLATQQINLDAVKLDDSDVNNLLKIDIASHNKDVAYILNVLQSDDLFYVSKALAKCTWLVTDQKYANIINPDYLQSELYPKMTTKAVIKLKKYIRHHIKDESRAEMFYSNEKVKSDAIKWLPYCSVPFIENNVLNHNILYDNPMKLRLFKRLCEKSITIFEIIIKHLNYYDRKRHLQVVTFFLNTNIDKYLDIIENNDGPYVCPKLNHNATALIMKHSPKRIIDKIDNYISMIHIPTFAKYFKESEIKSFLYSQAKKHSEGKEGSSNLRKIFYIDNLTHFINRLPKDEQFDFVKNSCMLQEKENVEQNIEIISDDLQMRKICNVFNQKSHIWYQFAPFNIAFEEITKLISQNMDTHEKQQLLSLLLKCAGHNCLNIQKLIKYFMNKHKNEEKYFKTQFVTEVLSYIQGTKYDSETWNQLNELITSMKFYEPSVDHSSNYREIKNYIIVYNIVNDQKPPEVVKEQFSFDTLITFRTCLDEEKQNLVFVYLYEHLTSQLKTDSLTAKTDFEDAIDLIKNILTLIKDWKKSFLDYPLILQKIRELISLKKKNSWQTSLTPLYNVNKSWRKHMFEESLTLCSNEDVCLNALKHGPQLLVRCGEEVEVLTTGTTDNIVSLHRLHRKLRVYWPHSLAQQWIDSYLNKIQDLNSRNAIVRHLCIVLPQTQLLNLIEEYKPKSPKIDWKLIDERVLNVQRLLAKNMHRGRPQPTPDAIIAYAVGDYLQFALPSLLAIFYNLKSTMHSHYIPKLLDAPVSIQKHGIRLAFEKLDREQLKKLFLNCWNTSKNISIRATIFKYSFTLLCTEKDPINAVSLWELLEPFIDNLTYGEDVDIYGMLAKVDQVPSSVRVQFLLKSYNFLQKLIPNVKEGDRSDYQRYCTQLASYSRELMETINQSFVKTIIEEFVENYFFKTGEEVEEYIYNSDGMIAVISAYVLCSKKEEDQLQKYEQIIVPIMQRSFENWGTKCSATSLFRKRFQELLTQLTCDLKDYVLEKNMIIPVKIYSLIQIELEKYLTVPENYMTLTKWKLTVALAKLLDQYSAMGENRDEKVGHEFGIISLEFLKSDITLHFPCIYILFSKCVKYLLDNIIAKPALFKFYDAILSDLNCIHAYLSFMEIADTNPRDEEYEQKWKRVLSHPSVEVKMHYYNKREEKEI